MVDRDIDRPDIAFRQGKFSILNSFCFVEILRYYYIISNNENNENDYQPEEFTDEFVEVNHSVNSVYPNVTLLMTSSERLKCR